MDRFAKKIILTRKQVEEKCRELGQWVDKEYRNSKDLILVGLLKGSVPFMAELMKNIQTRHTIDFITVSSYKGDFKSNGKLNIVMDLKQSIVDKDVLLVEDIIDSGLTLSVLTKELKKRHPNSLKTITLLNKKHARVVPFEADKHGFEVPNVFLYGFGLDVREKLRNLPYIAEFDQDKIDLL